VTASGKIVLTMFKPVL